MPYSKHQLHIRLSLLEELVRNMRKTNQLRDQMVELLVRRTRMLEDLIIETDDVLRKVDSTLAEFGEPNVKTDDVEAWGAW